MKKFFVLALLCLGLLGCASTHYLLATDFTNLPDKELKSYFSKVDGEIGRLERGSDQFTSANQHHDAQDTTVNLMVLTKGKASDLNALRLRRTGVRVELEERGLSVLEGGKV